MTTRRTFLTGCSVLATAAVLDPGALLAASPSTTRWTVPGLTAFAPEVGTRFRVLQAGVSLRLAEARAVTSPGRSSLVDGGERAFALLFLGPTDRPLTQDTYTLEHAGLGRVAMFLVPVMRQEGGVQRYEAIFNRQPGAFG